jgi:hypothetical protein
MTHLTRDQILARKSGRDVVTLADGATVEVQGLSRSQAEKLMEAPEGRERDVVMLAMGLTSPRLEPDDIRAMFDDGMNGDVLAISAKILELSGMAPGQAKDATKSVPG